MTRILMFLAAAAAGLAVLTAVPSRAAAAQMSYCQTWADRVAEHTVAPPGQADRKAIRDKAFYECLNMDEEPALPDSALGLFIDPTGSPFKSLDAPPVENAPGSAATFSSDEQPPGPEPLAQGDADDGDMTGLAETGPASGDDGQGRGSGKPRGSEEWAAFCAKYYPRSFDPQTGTVVPAKLGRRVPCR
jgi:hypothetical protein